MGKRQGVELMKIKWLGQSGYVLSDGRTVIYIDPYLSDSVSRIENRPRMRRIPVKPQDVKADGIICTHNHLDHLDIDAIPLIDKSIPVYAPSDCREALSELGVTNYAEFDEGAVYKIGDFKITAVFADHTVPAVVRNMAGNAYTLPEIPIITSGLRRYAVIICLSASTDGSET